MLNKMDLINLYLDFYEHLLTKKQQEVLNYYYRLDYSLSEISELMNISRAAVYDNIKRSNRLLEDYEAKLHLFEHYQKKQAIYQEYRQLNDNRINELIDKLKEFD